MYEFHFKQDLVTVHFVSKNFFSLRRHRSVSLCFSLLCYAQLLKSGLCTDQDSLYLLILYVNVMTVTGCCGHCRSNLVKQILCSKWILFIAKKMFTCGFARIQGYAFVLRGRLACVLRVVCCTLNLLPPIWCDQGWKDYWHDQK